MSEQTSNRGRKQGPSTRGRGRSSRGRGFFGTRKQEAARIEKEEQLQKEEEIIKEAEVLKQQPEHPKKQQLIQAGKSFFHQFISGLKKTTKNNVEVEFDEECVDRISVPYINRVKLDCQNNRNIDKGLQPVMSHFYEGYIQLAAGIKLMISASDNDHTKFRKFNDLKILKMRLPLKLTEAIDQIGKTDLGNEDILRVENQNMMAIRMMLKACATIFKHQQFNDYNVTVPANSWAAFYEKKNWRNCYTLDTNGVEYVRNQSRKMVSTYIDANYKYDGGITIRMPTFDFNELSSEALQEWAVSVGDIGKWKLVHKIVDKKKPNQLKDDDVTLRLQGSVLGCFITRNWLDNREKKLGEIEVKLKNTMFENLKVRDVLEACGFFCIEDILDYDRLIELVCYIQQLYSEKYGKHFENILNVREIQFKEFGTSAQIVLSEQTKEVKHHENGPYNEIRSDYIPSLYRQIDIPAAGFGLIYNYSKSVRIDQSYSINYNGNPVNTRDEFSRNDFK